MRTSFRRTAFLVTTVCAITAVSFTGCSTGSSFKMTKPSTWLSWSKKKPAATSLSSTRPSTTLPAPPSSTVTPNAGPSYAQASTAGSGQTGYASGAGASSQYANSDSGYTPARTAPATGYGYGSPSAQPGSSSAGFYSPNYPGSQTPSPASYGTASADSSGYGGDAYSRSYGTSGYGEGSTGTSGNSPGAYAEAAGSSYPNANPAAGASSYGQNPTQPSAGFGASADPGSTGYAGGASSYAGSASAPTPSANSGYPTTTTPGNLNQQATTPAPYQPGSTARATQFGSSEQLKVPGQESVQPASFAGGASGTLQTPTAPPARAGSYGYGGSTYGSGAYQAAPQTTTEGAGSSYPDTYRR